jgi:glycosyltransferase involved in cell wall biosynthesis
MMKVSVITATYNLEDTIERTLYSIKSQTFRDIQAVIVDGASRDNTISLVTPLLDENDILRSEPDLGIYDALNKGLALAEGEILAFLHSDDVYFDNNVISDVVDAFSDDTVDVVYGDVVFFSGRNVLKIKRRYRSDTLSEKNLAWGKMPAHTAMFIRRRVYEKIGYFDTDFKIAGDYDFLCRVVQYADLKSVYLSSVLVRMQLGGLSTGGFRNSILLNKEVFSAIRKNGIYTNVFMLLSKYPSKILQFLRI